MQNFKIKPEGFKELKRKLLIRAIPLLIIACVVGISIGTVNKKKGEKEVNVLPFVVPFVALATGYGVYRGINRQRATLESYTLTITNNLLTREQLNTPAISLYFRDVTQIVKQKDGGFIIKGKEASDWVFIPAKIDDYARLELSLQAIRSIDTINRESLLEKYRALAGLLPLGLMACVFMVQDKIIVALSGTALIGVMVWSFLEAWKSKNVDNKTKKSLWWTFVIIASVLSVMFYKLTGSGGVR
jgi:hypothetical protein